MNLVKTIALAALLSTGAQAQTNLGLQTPEPDVPFVMTPVASFNQPWRLAFLPDGRMLVTEKPGPIWLVTQTGQKTPVANAPEVLAQGQGGHAGRLPVAPLRDRPQRLPYLIGAGRWRLQPGAGPARLQLNEGAASLEDLKVIWRDGERGRGGQFGAQVAFSPDGKYLFLAVGERQRMTPAQDPDQPLGKILRLTLDGKPARGNPMAARRGAASVPVIDPPADTEKAKTAPVVRTLRLPGPQPHAGRNLDHRSSHALRPGLRARRPAVGDRAWTQGRRRTEPHRARQELRLAAGLLRDQLQRRAHSQPGTPVRTWPSRCSTGRP